MKVLDIKKPLEVFYVETDQESPWSWYVRTVDGNNNITWGYMNDYQLYISEEDEKLLEEAYIDYVERTFNGCA